MTGGSTRQRRAAGELESDVLAVLWAATGPITPSQVQLALGDLAYNTIHTILTRLLDKGLVIRVSQGSRAAYAPAKDAAQTVADQMRAVLASGTDRAQILTNFVTDLSPEDEAELRAALQRGRT